ncbi:hypothetical protein GmHk_18G053238 [Glycine max]|nr:hypothetical protein GmHk_18G053238 [Glycine max]
MVTTLELWLSKRVSQTKSPVDLFTAITTAGPYIPTIRRSSSAMVGVALATVQLTPATNPVALSPVKFPKFCFHTSLTSEPSDTELVSRHITNIETIKQSLLAEPEAECPHLLDITFSLLSSDESSSLIVSFFEAVIRVWYGVGMGDKSPGLDSIKVKWRRWIEVVTCSSRMSVLFEVKLGLKQGYSLAPFLLLIVAKGITCLVNKAVEVVGVIRDILQHADNSILFGELIKLGFWAIKAILRSFETISGDNIWIEVSFLNAASAFLHCSVAYLPFNFLGIPIGVNIPGVFLHDSKGNCLLGWKGRFVSFGGRITLIISVITILPFVFIFV